MNNYNEVGDAFDALHKKHKLLYDTADNLDNAKDELNIYPWYKVAESIRNNIESCDLM